MLPPMAPNPLTSEVAGALAGFFHAGSGPSHFQLTSVSAGAGYCEADPYDQSLGSPSKEQRGVAARVNAELVTAGKLWESSEYRTERERVMHAAIEPGG